MKKSVIKSVLNTTLLSLVTFTFIVTSGCIATTRNVDVDKELHYDESYDPTDKKVFIKKLVAPLLTRSFPAVKEKPVVVIYGIGNRTDEHIDTSGITDEIRKELINSGKFYFVSETQRDNIAKETSYQHKGPVDPATRIQLAKQVGAEYILSGTLRSIEKKQMHQIRVKKKTLKYYSLNLEMTNLENGLVEYADSVEIARESSKPIIGW